MDGALVVQVERGRAGEVHEVVGLDELLVAGALRVEAASRAQARGVAEAQRRGQPRRQRRPPVDVAPVQAHARARRESRRGLQAVLQPGAAARRASAESSASGRPAPPRTLEPLASVGLRSPLITKSTLVRRRCTSKPASSSVPAGRPSALLAQRDVAHRDLAVELHVRAGRSRRRRARWSAGASLRKPRVHVHRVGVPVPGERGVGVKRRAQRRVERAAARSLRAL